MSTTNPKTAELQDGRLPAVAVLLGDGVPAPLATIFGENGVAIEQAVATQVTWWPRKSITVHYLARCSGRLEGDQHIIACSGRIPKGAVVAESFGAKVGAWLLPHDPALPGLAAALDPRTAGQLLHTLGLSSEQVSTRLRAYRPTRRAVVEVQAQDGSHVYLKLVRPDEVGRLHEHHSNLPAGFPAPSTLGLDPALGLVVLSAMPGVTLREALENPSVELPALDDIDALLGQIPISDEDEVSASPIEQLPALTKLLARLIPDERERLKDMVDRVGKDTIPADTPVHGDFYEAQLLVDRGRITAVLDIDTKGWGRRGDDPSVMLGHLAVLQDSAEHPDRVYKYANDLLRRWDRTTDPVDLRRRTAAVIMGLATGPFRVQQENWPDEVRRRLTIADRWLDSAACIDDEDLIHASRPTHPAATYLSAPPR
ncbi:MAG: hypothetical protein ACOX8V_03745 [Thermoleophilia bacterium]|jgi:hypothetical protein